MPGASVRLGAVMDILSLPLIAPKLAMLVQKKIIQKEIEQKKTDTVTRTSYDTI